MSTSTSAITALAPSATSARSNARPKPIAPPVITAVRLWNLITALLSGRPPQWSPRHGTPAITRNPGFIRGNSGNITHESVGSDSKLAVGTTMGFSQSSASISVVAQGSEGGGAAIDQVIGMSVVALIVTVGLLWIGYLHRVRRITWLNNLAEWTARKFKRPPWVALPMALFITTLICALFGFIWDVSLHIGKGRDPGPLANPAHYFILFGLFLLFIAGCLACVLPYNKPGPSAVRITRDWYAPVGGLLMAGCGLYALIGFPLDDIWHRIFGQDVTLWGPTHLMMIGGAGFSTLAALMLNHEGLKAMGDDAPTGGVFVKFIQYLGFGGILIGLSVFQIEFDFGVPQFRQVFQPMLIAAAAAFGCVAARIMLGRGAAIIAALLAVALRGLVALIVGPILGAPINWFALYLGPAIVVELVALTPLVKRPVIFGAVSGL